MMVCALKTSAEVKSYYAQCGKKYCVTLPNYSPEEFEEVVTHYTEKEWMMGTLIFSSLIFPSFFSLFLFSFFPCSLSSPFLFLSPFLFPLLFFLSPFLFFFLISFSSF